MDRDEIRTMRRRWVGGIHVHTLASFAILWCSLSPSYP